LILKDKVIQHNWVRYLYYDIIYLDTYLFFNILIYF
jgi:hypothetical protein